MELDWSEQSAHIRSLYAPWQPGDGCEEPLLLAAEDRLGIHLPDPLRSFVLAWGRRKDLTRKNHPMLSPTEFLLQDGALVFWVENQACTYWAILLGDLTKANPPIARAYPSWHGSELASPLTWEPTSFHVSDFLDTLTYHHALCGGALHGGWTWTFQREEPQQSWLEQHWQRTVIAPMMIGLVDDFEDGLPFYVRPGQVLFSGGSLSAATCSVESLNELSQIFQAIWKHRW